MSLVVKIVSTPQGEAPEWVRQAWVGLRVPCLEDAPVSMPAVSAVKGPGTVLGQVFSLLRGKTERKRGYLVSARDVVGLLSLHNEAAAKWWLDNVPNVTDPRQLFLFEANCCQPVDARV
ncbi:hypothetical protein E4Z66_08970 [Aliishimia ponticola]|uniref:Uncharacterized protein n=1 Tax=Aliishimia ponticola TaxID=2499833 RepID=A0A4S4NLK9_9RHOB|nr:hypothetical protein [Aliishimia ponticola]THH37060.1 hypothetical protein E4Z66_08970 [Aliishimia ponticola]